MPQNARCLSLMVMLNNLLMNHRTRSDENCSLTVDSDVFCIESCGFFLNKCICLHSSDSSLHLANVSMTDLRCVLVLLTLCIMMHDNASLIKLFFSFAVNDCEPVYKPTDAIVPIAVGAALAGMVLIVLIGYCIGRRKTRAGYQNMNA